MLLVRIGIAFPFIFAGIGKFGMTKAMLAGAISKILGIPMGTAETLTVTIGALEILSGVLLIVGFLTKLAALFPVIILLNTIFVLSRLNLADPSLPAIWKDPALLLVAVALIIRGAGKLSLDARIAEGKK